MNTESLSILNSLLTIVADPSAAKAELEKLEKASAEFKKRQEASASAEKRTDEKLAALEQREIEIAKRENEFAALNSGFLLSLDLAKANVDRDPDRERLWVSAKLREVADRLGQGHPRALESILQINGPGPDARSACGNFAFHERTALGAAARKVA